MLDLRVHRKVKAKDRIEAPDWLRTLHQLARPTMFRSVEELRDRIVERLGLPEILFRATDLDGRTTPYGILVLNVDRILVLYPREAATLHQEHIKLHELCHVLSGRSDLTTSLTAAEYSDAVLDPIDALRKLLAPDLSRGMIQALLGTDSREKYRTTCDAKDDHEQDCEDFATTALRWIERERAPVRPFEDTSYGRLRMLLAPAPEQGAV